jgi:hypothetical protein
MDGCQEVSCGLIVASGDGSVLLELGEEVFDQMAGFVEVAVEGSGPASVSFWRDDGDLVCRRQRIENPLIGVEGFVGDEHIGLHLRQKAVGPDEVVGLTAAEAEPDWVA